MARSATPVKPGPEQFKVANVTMFIGSLYANLSYKLKSDEMMRLNRSITDSEGLSGGIGRSKLTLMV